MVTPVKSYPYMPMYKNATAKGISGKKLTSGSKILILGGTVNEFKLNNKNSEWYYGNTIQGEMMVP